MCCLTIWPYYLKVKLLIIESVICVWPSLLRARSLFLLQIPSLDFFSQSVSLLARLLSLTTSTAALHDIISLKELYRLTVSDRLYIYPFGRVKFSVFFVPEIASVSFAFLRPFVLGLQRYEPFLFSQILFFIFQFAFRFSFQRTSRSFVCGLQR
jgi:hypothetical protein